MTANEAVDILIKRGSNNDTEDEALETIAFKAQAFDIIKDLAEMSACKYGEDVILKINDKSLDIYKKADVRILKKVFEL